MKKILNVSALIAVLSGIAFAGDVFITVDQFGYRPDDAKVAVLRDPQVGFDATLSYTPGSKMNVVDSATGKTVFSGAPVLQNGGAVDESSGDKIWWFDFSSVTTAGTYYIQDAADATKMSFYFRIRNDIYNDVLMAAVKMLYYQRVGMAKEAKYAGKEWADGMNHAQDAKAHYFLDSTNTALERDVSGGWFDAGDYNKYTDWNGNYIENMMMAYLNRPKAFTDDYNIPESGNGIPDILDEVKWGLDHLLRLQNEDGSVISVVGESHASPPSAATGRTYYGAPNATATYSTAKAFAISSKIAKEAWGDEFYKKLYDGAIKAFDWAEAHQDSMFYNNDEAHGTKGLAAGQQEVSTNNESVNCSRLENRLKAALRMYDMTGEVKYRKLFEDNYESFPLMHGWGDSYRYSQHVMFLHYISLKDADATIKSNIEQKLVALMNKTTDFMGAYPTDGYRAFSRDYNWGSNGHKSSYGSLFDRLAGLGISGIDSKSYRGAAVEYLHYIHGVNPFGYVYVTNMERYGASNSISVIYHSWFRDGVSPAPGYLAGGPYSDYAWDSCCDKGTCGGETNNAMCTAEEIPVGQPSQKMYKNTGTGWPINSWSITEPSLGYQTLYIDLLSRFVEEKGVGINKKSAEEKKDSEKKDAIPANVADQVNVSFNGSVLQVVSGQSVNSVAVYDLQGRNVLSHKSAGNRLNLDCSGLMPGVYFVQLRVGTGNYLKTVTKMK